MIEANQCRPAWLQPWTMWWLKPTSADQHGYNPGPCDDWSQPVQTSMATTLDHVMIEANRCRPAWLQSWTMWWLKPTGADQHGYNPGPCDDWSQPVQTSMATTLDHVMIEANQCRPAWLQPWTMWWLKPTGADQYGYNPGPCDNLWNADGATNHANLCQYFVYYPLIKTDESLIRLGEDRLRFKCCVTVELINCK